MQRDALGTLFRPEPPTEVELATVIGSWIRTIDFRMDQLHLPKLGGIRCVYSARTSDGRRGSEPLSNVKTLPAKDGPSLETSGIWSVVNFDSRRGQARYTQIWGLVRFESLVLATLRYRTIAHGEEVARNVRIRRVTLPELLTECDLTPGQVMYGLLEGLQRAENAAKSELQATQELLSELHFDTRVIEMIRGVSLRVR